MYEICLNRQTLPDVTSFLTSMTMMHHLEAHQNHIHKIVSQNMLTKGHTLVGLNDVYTQTQYCKHPAFQCINCTTSMS